MRSELRNRCRESAFVQRPRCRVQRWRLQKEAIESVDTGLGKILKWAEVLYEYAQNNPQSMRLQRYWDHRGVKRDRVSTEAFARFKAINDELAEGLRRISRNRDSGSDVLSAMKHSLLQGNNASGVSFISDLDSVPLRLTQNTHRF